MTIAGALPYEKFQQIIDDELAEAKKLIQAGTKRTEVYKIRCEKNAKGAAEKPDRPERPRPEEDKTVWNVPVSEGDPIKGPATALVTLVMFSDFQCPYCKRVEDTVAQVEKEYKDKVRVVWKDNALPFHKRARPAATLAQVAYEEKGDKGFWDAHNALFESAPKLEDADLEAVAKKIGLSWDKVKKAIDDDKYAAKLQASADLAKKLNANGTPHFFANGVRIKGAQPFDAFKKVIDAQLAVADALVKKGIAPDKVYEEIMKGAEEPGVKKVDPPTADNPFKGGAAAKLVIQQFSDFQCPYCRRVEETVDQIQKTYGNKVKIVWRNMPLPFHKDARPAAEAACEAFAQKGADGFWKFHNKLFEAAGSGGVGRDVLEKIAQEIGLDMNKFKKALDENTHKDKIEADIAAAKKAGISGTPAFVIGTQFLSGAQPFDAFKKAIDEELKKVK